LAGLASKSLSELQAYLLNAIKAMETRRAEAEELIPQILDALAKRAAGEGSVEHPLTVLGYNVRWRNWRARERQTLLKWLMENPVPGADEREWGTPGSQRRRAFLTDTIGRWRQVYGQRENMANAAARWGRDIAFLESLPR